MSLPPQEIRIHRHSITDNFTLIPNALVANPELSGLAKAVAIYFLGKPPQWKVRIADLRNAFREGRDALYKALHELAKYGYARMQALRRGNRAAGVEWHIADTPRFLLPESQEPESQNPESQDHIKKEDRKIHSKKTNTALRDRKERQAMVVPKRLRERPAGLKPPPDAIIEDPPLSREEMERIAATSLCETAERRAKQKSKFTPSSFLRIWHDACKTGMPDVTHYSVTMVEATILCRYISRVFPGAPQNAEAFLQWVCSRWELIIAEQFGWMTRNGGPPALPSIKFLVRFKDGFEKAWHNRERLERLSSMSSRDRAITKLRQSTGMTWAAAAAEIDKRESETVAGREKARNLHKQALAQQMMNVTATQQAQAAQPAKWQAANAFKNNTQTTPYERFDERQD